TDRDGVGPGRELLRRAVPPAVTPKLASAASLVAHPPAAVLLACSRELGALPRMLREARLPGAVDGCQLRRREAIARERLYLAFGLQREVHRERSVLFDGEVHSAQRRNHRVVTPRHRGARRGTG